MEPRPRAWHGLYALNQPWLSFTVQSAHRPLQGPALLLLAVGCGGGVGGQRKRARHNRHGLGKGRGSPARLRRARPPLSVRSLANSWAGGNPHKASLSQRRRVRATWPDRGWSGQESSEESGAQVLRGSRTGLGEPCLLSPRQISPTPGPAFPPPPSHSGSPFHPGPGVTAPPTLEG